MYAGPPKQLTPGQKLAITAAQERSKCRHIPMTARSQSAPPDRPGQRAVVLSLQPLRVRQGSGKGTPRCGRLAAGSHAEVVTVEGTRAEIRLPSSRHGETGWVTAEKQGRVLLGRDFDWEGHIERVQPFRTANPQIARLLDRLDPIISGRADAARNADSRRKQVEWSRRQEDNLVRLLNELSIKQHEPKRMSI